MEKLYLALTYKKRLLLFIFTFIISFFVISLLSGLIMWKFGPNTAALRIVTIIQDVMFIVPPVFTAVIVTRQPATLLGIDRAPKLTLLFVAVCALLASIPAMNFIIYLNQNIPLPESIAIPLRALEDNAENTIKAMYGPHTITNLIMTILIVGVLAGLSEELLFRGGLQRLMVTGGVNVHAAIWTTAFVFSLIHFQFYGFIPRLLLGAFFGYLLYWTRTLWIPIILHIINNTLYVTSEWLNYDSDQSSVIDTIGSGSDYLWIIISTVITAVMLIGIHKLSKNNANLK